MASKTIADKREAAVESEITCPNCGSWTFTVDILPDDGTKAGESCPLCRSPLSGRNTETIRRRIAKAARLALPYRVRLNYEHGQWWAVAIRPDTEGKTGTWAVEDAEGPGSFDGFTFEEV